MQISETDIKRMRADNTQENAYKIASHLTDLEWESSRNLNKAIHEHSLLVEKRIKHQVLLSLIVYVKNTPHVTNDQIELFVRNSLDQWIVACDSHWSGGPFGRNNVDEYFKRQAAISILRDRNWLRDAINEVYSSVE